VGLGGGAAGAVVGGASDCEGAGAGAPDPAPPDAAPPDAAPPDAAAAVR
jgi:hypothetical protein